MKTALAADEPPRRRVVAGDGASMNVSMAGWYGWWPLPGSALARLMAEQEWRKALASLARYGGC